ncbi:MAG: hypothetical protein JWM80_2931 [Cyanobacteria bacterium RYN_339]|nr:hypothetical protein [Cyanobacteria bacterium RYN_339]
MDEHWFSGPDGSAAAASLKTLLGAGPEEFYPVMGGFTPVQRAVARLADGRRVFLKRAINDLTAGWLAAEHRFYASTSAAFLPAFLGYEPGTLVLEDLSAARWVPPWLPGDVEAVVAVMGAIAATPAPLHLPALRKLVNGSRGWREVAQEPEPFLALGLCCADWLAAALPHLIAAADAAPFDGTELVHLDLRSDNLCMAERGPVVFDWNMASIGNAKADLAFWLSSLHAEGGPAPEAILPEEPEFAAWVAGFFAAHAGLPPIPNAPRVRQIQRTQLETGFPWAVRALKLPTPWVT